MHHLTLVLRMLYAASPSTGSSIINILTFITKIFTFIAYLQLLLGPSISYGECAISIDHRHRYSCFHFREILRLSRLSQHGRHLARPPFHLSLINHYNFRKVRLRRHRQLLELLNRERVSYLIIGPGSTCLLLIIENIRN